jgi:DNA-binding response OmpR family regulator
VKVKISIWEIISLFARANKENSNYNYSNKKKKSYPPLPNESS